MTEKTPEDEPGAEERFDKAVKNALRMPPKPHVKKSETDSARSGKKRAAPKSGPKSS